MCCDLCWRMNFVPPKSRWQQVLLFYTWRFSIYLCHLCLPITCVWSSSPFLSRHLCWRSRLGTLRLTFHGSTLPWIILARACSAFLDNSHRSNNEDLVALGYLHTGVHHNIDPRVKKHQWWELGYLLSSLKSPGYKKTKYFQWKVT